MRKISLPAISLSLCSLLLIFAAANVLWNPNRWQGIVRSDGKGYYAYLPATIVYKDLNFGFFEEIEAERYFQEQLFFDYRFDANGHTVDRYFAGPALMLAPFYLLGHFAALLTDFPADGYSQPYYFAVHAGAIFYTLLGLWFCVGLLRNYNIADKHIALVLPAILIGTNLFYYAMMEPLMSHHFSFCLISALLLLTRKWLGGSSLAIFWMGVCIGLIVLVRPINVVVIALLPFLASKGSVFWLRSRESFFRSKAPLFWGVGISLCIAGLQLWIYYRQTGSPWVYSYGEYRIDLSNPHFWQMLFSYRKGWFLYTPIALLSLLGFYFWGKRNTYQALGHGIFLFTLVYLLSCWDFWFYGGSFGSRVFIDYYAIIALLLGMSWRDLPKRFRMIFTLFVILLILICQVQIFQYRYQEILWDNMTRELYWDRFLRIDRILWP